jgi:uncharacterized YigZ family protein
MNLIQSDISNEIVINKSRFICHLIKINSELDVEDKINELKKEYKDATHYCYAYITGNVKRFNDDKEPSGTAGMPILNVLENNNLNNVLCVVIRYFGGIKLGAGGLVRAYTKAVVKCLEKCTLKEMIEGYLIEIEFNYNNVKEIDYLLKDKNIIKKEFLDNIIYQFEISKKDYELNKKLLSNLCISNKIISEILY